MRVAPRVAERIKKYQENLKTSLNYSLVPSATPKMKILSILPKTAEKKKLTLSRGALLHTKTKACLKYPVHGCSLEMASLDSPTIGSPGLLLMKKANVSKILQE